MNTDKKYFLSLVLLVGSACQSIQGSTISEWVATKKLGPHFREVCERDKKCAIYTNSTTGTITTVVQSQLQYSRKNVARHKSPTSMSLSFKGADRLTRAEIMQERKEKQNLEGYFARIEATCGALHSYLTKEGYLKTRVTYLLEPSKENTEGYPSQKFPHLMHLFFTEDNRFIPAGMEPTTSSSRSPQTCWTLMRNVASKLCNGRRQHNS